MSIILNPTKSLSANSTEEFLSESGPLIMQPENLTALECMGKMEDEDSGQSVAFETEKGVDFMDLTLTMTIELDLPALNSSPAQVRAVVYWESHFSDQNCIALYIPSFS